MPLHVIASRGTREVLCYVRDHQNVGLGLLGWQATPGNALQLTEVGGFMRLDPFMQ